MHVVHALAAVDSPPHGDLAPGLVALFGGGETLLASHIKIPVHVWRRRWLSVRHLYAAAIFLICAVDRAVGAVRFRISWPAARGSRRPRPVTCLYGPR